MTRVEVEATVVAVEPNVLGIVLPNADVLVVVEPIGFNFSPEDEVAGAKEPRLLVGTAAGAVEDVEVVEDPKFPEKVEDNGLFGIVEELAAPVEVEIGVNPEETEALIDEAGIEEPKILIEEAAVVGAELLAVVAEEGKGFALVEGKLD